MTKAGRSEPQYLYLMTQGRRSGKPREIEIWFTRRDGRYYLIAEHGRRANWVRNLVADPAVRLRVGRRTVRARARVVDPRVERALVRAVRQLSQKKYGWGDGLVVELAPMKSAQDRRRHAAPVSDHSRTPPGSRTPLQ